MGVPLFDCRIDSAGIAAADAVLESGQLAAGPHVAALEAELSARVGGRPVVVLSDMTQALELALRLAGIGAGDPVATLSYNCLSSNAAIARVGAAPLWVDIVPETASMDVEHARARLADGARALVVYHAAGYPADVRALRRLCDAAGAVLIEDANNALGAQLPGGGAAGTIGDFAIFSFYANRQVNAVEGGALVCPSEEVAARVRHLRRFGIDQSRFRDPRGEIDPGADVPEIGVGATLPNVNAALARHNLALLDARLEQVRANAAAMSVALAELPGVVPVRAVGDAMPVHWGLLLLCTDRDARIDRLKAAGIGCSKLHQPNHVYSGFVRDAAALPGTARFMEGLLAVPCGWWVGPDERQEIIAAIRGN